MRDLIELFEIPDLEHAKLILRSNSIDYEVKFENTLQLGNAYALGNNGAVITVPDSQFEIARNLLIENNFINPIDESNVEFEFVKRFEKLLDISFLKGKSFVFKLFTSVTLFLVCIMAYTVSLSYKSLSEFSYLGSWCVEYVEINGQKYAPYTVAGENDIPRITIYYDRMTFCQEKIWFRSNNISLPGINSPEVHGTYNINEDYSSLTINFDENQDSIFYSSEYKIHFNNLVHSGTLQSDNVNIKFRIDSD